MGPCDSSLKRCCLQPQPKCKWCGAWCGRHGVITVPGKEDADSDSWLHLHSGLIFHSQVAPLNDQPGWMDCSSHSGWDQSGGLSAHHSAWDPGGLFRPGQTHHGPIAGRQSFIPVTQNLYSQNGIISQDWYPWLVLRIIQDHWLKVAPGGLLGGMTRA